MNPYSYEPVKPVVETRFGKLRGACYGGVNMFMGVKYADAPRFQLPVEPQPWEGVKNAYVYGPISPQMGEPNPFPFYRGILLLQKEGEDCQNLNIWAPRDPGNGKKPVFVWIHGGGFMAGNAMEEYSFDGFHLAREGDVVFVSVNHRLNILGYMNLTEYGEAFAESPNLGLWDLVMALKWIHENIAAFGGDPDNVTICGHSGGGGKVLCLYQMPEAAPYFQRGICLSGATPEGPASEPEDTRVLAREMLAQLGITKDNIDEVYTVSFRRLCRAYRQVASRLWNEGRCVVFEPQKTARFIGFPPFNGFASCSGRKPLIVSTVMAEFAVCPVKAEEKAAMNEADKIAFLRRTFGEKADGLITRFRSSYPEHDLMDIFCTDTVFRRPTVETALEKARCGANNTYVFLAALNTLEDGNPPMWHGADVGYAFRNEDRVFILNDPVYGPQMSDIFSSILLNFARTGDPNNACLPRWEPFTEDEPWTMVIDKVCELKRDIDPETGKSIPFDSRYLDLLSSCVPPFRLPAMFAEEGASAQIEMDK